MSVYLNIFDVDSSRPVDSKMVLVLELPEDKIKVRELIERRVHAEVNRYNAGEKIDGLVKPTDMESRLNEEAKNRRFSAERQIAIALKAFNNNGFFLLVDDEQVTDLEDIISVNDDTKVEFFRLVMLVGG